MYLKSKNAEPYNFTFTNLSPEILPESIAIKRSLPSPLALLFNQFPLILTIAVKNDHSPLEFLNEDH